MIRWRKKHGEQNVSAYDVVAKFEEEVAAYAGAKYAVAISSCTNAIFLCCKYLDVKWVHIPRYTYPGVACSIIHAGGKACFTDEHWAGVYRLRPYPIYDSALRFKKGMYIPASFYCLSFHGKKHLPIGRGGMILTDSLKAQVWLKRARYDGRGEKPLSEDKIITLGWNMYMTPEQASRGRLLLNLSDEVSFTDLPVYEQGYIDLSKVEVYYEKGICGDNR